jgi:hypothetical protein
MTISCARILLSCPASCWMALGRRRRPHVPFRRPGVSSQPQLALNSADRASKIVKITGWSPPSSGPLAEMNLLYRFPPWYRQAACWSGKPGSAETLGALARHPWSTTNWRDIADGHCNLGYRAHTPRIFVAKLNGGSGVSSRISHHTPRAIECRILAPYIPG